MRIGKSGRISCRNDAALPRTKKCGQAPRLDISHGSRLPGLRFFGIYCPENGIGAAIKPHSNSWILSAVQLRLTIASGRTEPLWRIRSRFLGTASAVVVANLQIRILLFATHNAAIRFTPAAFALWNTNSRINPGLPASRLAARAAFIAFHENVLVACDRWDDASTLKKLSLQVVPDGWLTGQLLDLRVL
jgi:hypothetical protein